MEEKKLMPIKKKYHPLRLFLYVLFSICIVTFIVIESVIIYYGHRKVESQPEIIIILGARLYGSVPSPSLEERLETGFEYLVKNENAFAVVSGGIGKGEDISEAAAMKDYLIKKGISEERILLEDDSTNTFQNIIYSKKLIEKNLPDFDLAHEKIGIVTNDYHVFRGVMMAKRFGLDAVGIPARTPPTTLLKGYAREYFGVIKYIFLDRE
ncbi:MAG: YdcF family protein [Clostridiaceae bacterium]